MWYYEYSPSWGHCVRTTGIQRRTHRGEMVDAYIAHALKTKEAAVLLATAPPLLEAAKLVLNAGLDLSPSGIIARERLAAAIAEAEVKSCKMPDPSNS